MSKEAMNLALEALEGAWLDASMGKGDVARHRKAVAALQEAMAEQPEPSFGGVLFAVEEVIRNGDCPFQIENAFDEYEADRKAAHGIGEKK